jgi:hypothetical protein
MSDYKEVRTTEHEQGRGQRVATFKVTQLIWLFLGILEALIALRIFFKLIGVNSTNAFATLLYGFTNLFVAPFASLIGAPASDGMVLEISSIIAMIVYFLFAWGLERIVYVLFYRPRGPVSVSQTSVSQHTAQPVQTGVSQTTTTTTAVDDSHTSDTARTNTNG